MEYWTNLLLYHKGKSDFFELLFLVLSFLHSTSDAFHLLTEICPTSDFILELFQGIPNNVPRHNKPRRVDLYYSSWCIRPGIFISPHMHLL
jgi:hypothetical protein